MIKSIRCHIRGAVQGVGFRPWVYRLAHQMHIKGFVQNTSQGISMEIEGPEDDVENFLKKIRRDPPQNCVITQCQETDISPQGFSQFEILTSQGNSSHETLVLPDLATCPECLDEVFDPQNRRYLYPFTNCTHCGPRYSIIEALPYDRKNTTMKKFIMCPQCRQEYSNPLDRRFHAQPNACPNCGPQVSLWDHEGIAVATAKETLPALVALLKLGAIVAVKALGGFYLMADASNSQAVSNLRKRKSRPHKPFAVLMPSIQMMTKYCEISLSEEELLISQAAPIVLLRKKESGLKIADEVSLGNPYLGCMLPSMPLLHILSRMFLAPLVATSGNVSEEPICIHNSEALQRLKGIADYFLVHDRPIVRNVDDSVVQLVCDELAMIRRARGYAPLAINISEHCDGVLAVGAHQKNTIALGVGSAAIVTQHIGDLDNEISCTNFEKAIIRLRNIYDAPIKKVICDSHPNYFSSRIAHGMNTQVIEVQHHHAHIASCMAEYALRKKVLGICFDGTGYGEDLTIWGGEFLLTDGASFRRFAHLKTFPLPGGESAIKEPKRTALGLLYSLCDGNWQEYQNLPCIKAFNAKELLIIQKMIKQNINSPVTSSMGRLFDGIASLIGLMHETSFEGQAAMALEFQVSDHFLAESYPYKLFHENDQSVDWTIDWEGIIKGIIEDMRLGKPAPVMATRFHQTIVEIMVQLANQSGQKEIVLSGGCFQNRWLLEASVARLRQEGLKVYWNTQVPVNDGGISLGQMYVGVLKNLR